MVRYWRFFVPYAVFMTASGAIHAAQARDIWAFVAWEVVYLPFAALIALYLLHRKLAPVVPRKTRIVKSVLIGLAIPAAVVALGMALK